MKNLIILCLMALLCLSANAEYINIKGGAMVNSDEIISIETICDINKNCTFLMLTKNKKWVQTHNRISKIEAEKELKRVTDILNKNRQNTYKH